MRRGLLTSTGLIVAAIALGCGGGAGGGETSLSVSTPDAKASLSVPTPDLVAACFKRKGVTAVYEKKERGVRFVNGLVGGANAVSAEFTGTKAKSEELLRRYEAEASPGLEAFEVLEGAAVGVINKREPASKQIVLDCFE